MLVFLFVKLINLHGSRGDTRKKKATVAPYSQPINNHSAPISNLKSQISNGMSFRLKS